LYLKAESQEWNNQPSEMLCQGYLTSRFNLRKSYMYCLYR
jgi:hypothetical protein